jgi:hypothetical protein
MGEEIREVIAEQATRVMHVAQRSGPGRPPENEIPVAIPADFQWRGEGIVVAIPVLLVYTAAVGMVVMGRTRDALPPRSDQARADMVNLRGLTVDGRRVEFLTGQHDDHGFMYQGWAMLRAGESGRDLVLALDWPGIEPAERRMPAATVTEAARQVTVLWT